MAEYRFATPPQPGHLKLFHSELMRKVWICSFIVTVIGAGTPARAQIYAWRDGSGNLVLSDHQAPGTGALSYAVPNAETPVRTTRHVVAELTRAYEELILEHARQNAVRPDLVRAVVQVESAYNRYARSPKGAVGLMQLMPATMRQFGVSDPYNPVDNIRAGVAYLRQLLDRYNDNEELALAAYNAGPSAVDKHGQSVPPYAETRQYVSKVTTRAGTAVVPPSTRIYRVVEIVDGREVVKYTDRQPQ